MATGNGGQTVRLPVVVTVERDDLGEVYVARCLAVEVASHGHTQEQALANLRERSSSTSRTAPSRRST